MLPEIASSVSETKLNILGISLLHPKQRLQKSLLQKHVVCECRLVVSDITSPHGVYIAS